MRNKEVTKFKFILQMPGSMDGSFDLFHIIPLCSPRAEVQQDANRVCTACAGGFGTALLLGLLPVCMTWAGRYHLGYRDHFQVRGGKPVLVLMALFVLIEVSFEILHLLHVY